MIKLTVFIINNLYIILGKFIEIMDIGIYPDFRSFKLLSFKKFPYRLHMPVINMSIGHFVNKFSGLKSVC